MSRSKRKPAYYTCKGANPSSGKKSTSRAIRRTVRQALHTEEEDFDFAHPQDKNRGNAGSRAPDWGWGSFGDGRRNPYWVESHLTEDEKSAEWFQRICRK